MTHWEFSHIPFDGDKTDDEIVCQKCGWHWKVKDGGDDLYVCHKCYTDNSKYYLSNSNFEGNTSPNSGGSTDWGKVISSGIDTASKFIPQSGSRLNEDAKQSISTKKEAQALKKRINAECRAKPVLGKKKKAKWDECKNRVIDKFDYKSNELKTQREIALKAQQELQKQAFKENSKKRNLTYVVVGVVALILGVAIYKKMNK